MHPIRSSRCSCSTHHSNLKQLMTPCQILQQQAGRRDQCVLACLPCCPYTKLCSRRYGLAALSLSDTVLGRRVSLRVWSRTQIALALRGCMVLISVNTVLRLLKRSTCVRGRTHLVVVAICRFEADWPSHNWVRNNNIRTDLPFLTERQASGDDAKRRSRSVTRRATSCPHCWLNT